MKKFSSPTDDARRYEDDREDAVDTHAERVPDAKRAPVPSASNRVTRSDSEPDGRSLSAEPPELLKRALGLKELWDAALTTDDLRIPSWEDLRKGRKRLGKALRGRLSATPQESAMGKPGHSVHAHHQKPRVKEATRKQETQGAAKISAEKRATPKAAPEKSLDAEGVRAVTLLLLGRYPNQNDDIEARAQLGVERLVKRVIRSDECGARMLPPLLAGDTPIQARHEPVPPPWLKESLSRVLVLTEAGRQSVRVSRDWADLLRVVLGDEEFVRHFLSEPPSSKWFLRTLELRRASRRLVGSNDRATIAATRVAMSGEIVVELSTPNCDPRSSFTLRPISNSQLTHAIPHDAVTWERNKARATFPLPRGLEDEQGLLVSLESQGEPPDDYAAVFLQLRVAEEELNECRQRAEYCLNQGKYEEAEKLLDWLWRTARSESALRYYVDLLVLRGSIDEALRVVSDSKLGGECQLWRAGLLARVGDYSAAEREALSCEAAGVQPEVSRLLASCLAADHENTEEPVLSITRSLIKSQPWSVIAELAERPLDISGEDAWRALQTCMICRVAPTSSWALLQTLMHQGLVTLEECLERAKHEGYDVALTPVLAEADPALFTDGVLLLRLARYHERSGDVDRGARFALAAVRCTKPPKDAAQVASILCQRAGLLGDAAELLRQLIVSPNADARLHLRLCGVERQLVLREPSRSRRDLTGAVDRTISFALKNLTRNPSDDSSRLVLARALVAGERHTEAAPILRALVHSCPRPELRSAAAREFVRAAEHLNLMEEAIPLTAELYENEPGPVTALLRAKALRAVGRASEAQPLLERHCDDGDIEVVRETVRNLFFLADFGHAAMRAEKLIEVYPDDLHLRLYAASAYREAGDARAALYHAEFLEVAGGRELFPHEVPLLMFALLKETEGAGPALSHLNAMFARLGCQRIGLAQDADTPLFDSLSPTGEYPESESDQAPLVFDGPLVSVIMTAYNAEAYLETAVRSILEQSYENLELIIVDDASDDRTPEILLALQKRDARVKPVLRCVNSGTYVCKNTGLLQARGELVALQDSDDWSHPDRLAKVIGYLQGHPETIAVTTDWIRMTSDGDVVIKAGAQISHVCCISLVFRRVPVVQRIGFFDSVRIEADMEFIRRIRLAFGSSAVLRLGWPLLFGRAHAASLTASSEYGITRTGYTEPRLRYQAAQRAWHAEIAANASPFVSFPLERRTFEAPEIMLPERAVP